MMNIMIGIPEEEMNTEDINTVGQSIITLPFYFKHYERENNNFIQV